MKGIPSTLFAFVICLSVLAEAQRGPGNDEDLDSENGRGPGRAPPISRTDPVRTSTITSTVVAVPSQSTSIFSISISNTNTISSSLSSFSTLPATADSSKVQSSSTSSATAGTSQTPVVAALEESSAMSNQHRTLVIILSSVLGSIGVLLAALVLFLVCRHRRRHSFRRGVSPINDDEIESWRNTERKQSTSLGNPELKGYEAGVIGLATSPTSAGFIRSPPAAKMSRSAYFLAKAPNARAGLTDEAIPGDSPFVASPKRQSSRLSKAQPGHSRTKSRGSSTSAKSIRSMNGGAYHYEESRTTENNVRDWYDPEYNNGRNHFFAPTLATASTPGTSIYDGLNEQGGLSPRPKSKAREPFVQFYEIGRAIS